MAGTGIEGPTRVSLGKNSRIAVGGPPWQFEWGSIHPLCDRIGRRFGPSQDASDNMSGGFVERTRNNRAASRNVRFSLAASRQSLSCEWPEIRSGLGNGPDDCLARFHQRSKSILQIPLPYCEGASVVAVGNGDVRGSVRMSSQSVYYTPARPDPGGVFA
jgi:hypothetical protein